MNKKFKLNYRLAMCENEFSLLVSFVIICNRFSCGFYDNKKILLMDLKIIDIFLHKKNYFDAEIIKYVRDCYDQCMDFISDDYYLFKNEYVFNESNFDFDTINFMLKKIDPPYLKLNLLIKKISNNFFDYMCIKDNIDNSNIFFSFYLEKNASINMLSEDLLDKNPNDYYFILLIDILNRFIRPYLLLEKQIILDNKIYNYLKYCCNYLSVNVNFDNFVLMKNDLINYLDTILNLCDYAKNIDGKYVFENLKNYQYENLKNGLNYIMFFYAYIFSYNY